MVPGDPAPYHSVTMTVVANRPDSRVENTALIQSSSPRLDRLHTLQPAQPEGSSSSPLTAISPDQYNFTLQDQHVRHLPLNGFKQAPISEVTSGQPGAPQPSHESIALSSNSSHYHDSLNPSTHRPRTYNQVFHSTSDLAAHHGIPQSFPPLPRTTPRRSSEPESIPDFSLSTLCSNYLTMLASNSNSEQTSTSEVDPSAALPMSPDDKAAAQAIASALTASPEFFNPSDFLTSPVSPFDDLLTTPALDDMGMTPDIYTSPLLQTFGDDFDNLPSLFDNAAYNIYDAKATMSTSLTPSDLPLADMDADGIYKISPESPAIDALSLHGTPVHADSSSVLPTRRKTVPTGTRKNVTPETLVPFDAPIQSRQYRTPSSTSRKELPATFARKRARTQGPGEEETVNPTLSEEDAIRTKRLQNTLAARRSRKRKLEYQRELEDAIDAERREKEMWRGRVLVLEALLRDKGYDVPPMSAT
jgi:hypothetical protein